MEKKKRKKRERERERGEGRGEVEKRGNFTQRRKCFEEGAERFENASLEDWTDAASSQEMLAVS